MKLFIQIFTFYLVTLAFLPCGVSLTSLSSCCTEIAVADDMDDSTSTVYGIGESHDDESEGPCSPLCDCFSCAHAIDYPQLSDISITPPPVEPSTRTMIYVESLGTLSISDIWQPPRQLS